MHQIFSIIMTSRSITSGSVMCCMFYCMCQIYCIANQHHSACSCSPNYTIWVLYLLIGYHSCYLLVFQRPNILATFRGWPLYWSVANQSWWRVLSVTVWGSGIIKQAAGCVRTCIATALSLGHYQLRDGSTSGCIIVASLSKPILTRCMCMNVHTCL